MRLLLGAAWNCWWLQALRLPRKRRWRSLLPDRDPDRTGLSPQLPPALPHLRFSLCAAAMKTGRPRSTAPAITRRTRGWMILIMEEDEGEGSTEGEESSACVVCARGTSSRGTCSVDSWIQDAGGSKWEPTSGQ